MSLLRHINLKVLPLVDVPVVVVQGGPAVFVSVCPQLSNVSSIGGAPIAAVPPEVNKNHDA